MKNLKLKSARAALDLSQQELADRVGVSRQTINAIEKGIPLRQIAHRLNHHPNNIYTYTKARPQGLAPVQPTLGRLLEIADILGITVDELARGPHGEGLQDG